MPDKVPQQRRSPDEALSLDENSGQLRAYSEPARLVRALAGFWGPKSRPIDLCALSIIVLGTVAIIDSLSDTEKLSVGLVLARTASIVLIVLVVVLLAATKPEALNGKRRSRRR